MLSPADSPTLSPAGPGPSPGGVSFSPYGSSSGVSPAGAVPFGSGQAGSATISPSGSTVVSPAAGCSRASIGSGYGDGGGGGGYGGYSWYGGGGYNPPRISMASATEEMDEDAEDAEEGDEENEERLAMGLAPLGEGRPSSSVSVGGGAAGAGAEGARGRDADITRLFELADELGGQGASGLRWSELAIFDDQVCCFVFGFILLLTSHVAAVCCFCVCCAIVQAVVVSRCGVDVSIDVGYLTLLLCWRRFHRASRFGIGFVDLLRKARLHCTCKYDTTQQSSGMAVWKVASGTPLNMGVCPLKTP